MKTAEITSKYWKLKSIYDIFIIVLAITAIIGLILSFGQNLTEAQIMTLDSIDTASSLFLPWIILQGFF